MLLKDKNGEVVTLLHNDIIKLIPHRFPFLLIDKLTDIIINKLLENIIINSLFKYLYLYIIS